MKAMKDMKDMEIYGVGGMNFEQKKTIIRTIIKLYFFINIYTT